MLFFVLQMKGIDHPDKSDQGKDIAKGQTETVDPAENKLLPHEGDRAMVPLRNEKKREETEYRSGQQNDLLRFTFHKKEKNGSDEEEGGGMNPLNHVVLRSSLPASSIHILRI